MKSLSGVFLLAISFLLFSACGEKNYKEEVKISFGNIINGERVSPSDESIIRKSTVFVGKTVYSFDHYQRVGCTGVLISKNVVLTAAHCQDSFKWIAFYNTYDLQYRKMTKIISKIIHPEYNSIKVENDIALLFFESPLPHNIEPIKILNNNSFTKKYYPIQVSGHSVHTTSYWNNILDVIRIKPRSGYTNYRASNGNKMLFTKTVSFDHLDLDDQTIILQNYFGGTCFGDSGGPVTVNINNENYLVGITSTLLGHLHIKDCDALSTSVAVNKYKDWIINSIQKEGKELPIFEDIKIPTDSKMEERVCLEARNKTFELYYDLLINVKYKKGYFYKETDIGHDYSQCVKDSNDAIGVIENFNNNCLKVCESFENYKKNCEFMNKSLEPVREFLIKRCDETLSI